MFYNYATSYPIINHILERNTEYTQLYLKCYEHMCNRIPKPKKGYKYNKVHLNKFFIESLSTMFTQVFEGERLARVLDRFVSNGVFVLISVLILIAEQLETLKMETLHYERAKVMIIQKAKSIDFMKLCFTLMNCNSDKEIFEEYLRSKELKLGLVVGVDQFLEERE